MIYLLIYRNDLFSAPRVAVIREEGTNGDREMSASLHLVGFEVWDIVMQDLLDKKITVDQFRGIVFPGGFSYAGRVSFLLVYYLFYVNLF